MATRIDVAFVEILPDLSRFDREAVKGIKDSLKGAGRSAEKASKDIEKSFNNSFDSIKKGARAAGVALTAAFAVQGAASAASFAASLAPVVGALAATLPAAAVTAAAAIGTLNLAFKGLDDIFKNLDDPEKFAEALAKLSPSARDFATALRDLLPTFQGFQRAIQERFFVGLDDDLRRVTSTLLGPLKTGLSGIAEQFNLATREVSAFATSPEAVAALNSILLGTQQILASLLPAIQPLLGGFAALAAAAQPFLVQLSDAIAKAATEFGAFLSEAAKSGALTEFFDAALSTLKELSPILKGVGSIFGSIFKAATSNGNSLLESLGQIVTLVADFFKTPEGAAALTALFEAIRTLTSSVLEVVKPLLPLFGQLVVLAGAQLGNALKLLAAFLTPVIQALSDALLPVMPQLIDAAKQLTPVLVQLGTILGIFVADAINSLLPPIIQLLPLLVDLLIPAIKILTGVIAILTPVISSLIAVLGFLIGVFAGFWASILRQAKETLEKIVGIVESIPVKLMALGGFFVNAGKFLINGLIGAINTGIGGLDKILPGKLGRIPLLQAGGITTGPVVAGLGEAGAEAVLPLSGTRGQQTFERIAAAASGGPVINFGPGSVSVGFEGVVPTEQQALQTGQAVGMGIAAVLERRNIRTQVRLI